MRNIRDRQREGDTHNGAEPIWAYDTNILLCEAVLREGEESVHKLTHKSPLFGVDFRPLKCHAFISFHVDEKEGIGERDPRYAGYVCEPA